MRLSDIATVLQRAGNNEARIWKMLAYVGRYGHQPINVAMRLTGRELGHLAESVAELVREENEAGAAQRED